MSHQLAAVGLLDAIQAVNIFIGKLIPIAVGLALLGFFWGLVKFMFKAGDESAQEEGRRIMVWGVIALFVMLAVWGIVKFIADSLGLGTGGTETGIIQVPTSE